MAQPFVGQNGFVVLDTAPTAHTLLRLDAAQVFHRDVSRTLGGGPEAVRNLLPRQRHPQFTRVVPVILPEATPVHEADRLQDDLLRAQPARRMALISWRAGVPKGPAQFLQLMND